MQVNLYGVDIIIEKYTVDMVEDYMDGRCKIYTTMENHNTIFQYTFDFIYDITWEDSDIIAFIENQIS